jgi:ADP-ribose pyrophosphatase YjhB (NUDIX family)
MTSEKLFNPSPKKLITAVDLFGHRQQRQLQNFKFRPSVYGLLIQDGRLLMKRHPAIAQFDFPGGGIEIAETIPEALIREFKEEVSLTVKPTRLFGVADSFFTDEGQDAHGILIFYLVELVSGQLKTNGEDSAEAKYFELATIKPEQVILSCRPIITRLQTRPSMISQTLGNDGVS